MKPKIFKMDESILELKLELESELVRNDSMKVLNEFEESEDLSRLENYS
jgi:hypothetical protein